MNKFALSALTLGWLLPVALLAQGGVDTTVATTLTVPREVRLDGTVEAVQQGTITAQTGGQIEEILFDVDDPVERGQVIVRLRDTQQKAVLAQAEAALREAQAGLKQAQDEQRRIQEVFAKKLGSSAEMDQANAALEAATARVAQAEAAQKQAREQLDYTQVRAPYSGIVTRRHAELGEIAQPGKPLMTGIALERLRVLVAVPQGLALAVRQQNKAVVLLPSGEPVPAERITLFPLADPASNTFMVRADLPRGVPGLLPGMFVKTAFSLGEERLLAIPQGALAYRGEVTGVYVRDAEGRWGFRHVRPGRKLDHERIAVLAGLNEGESVALDPIAAGVALKAQGAEAGHVH